MNLGVVWKDGEIINHRSLLKILFNPILRCFGWQIASEFAENKWARYVIIKADAACQTHALKWALAYNNEGCIVEKKRRII